jgi:hypothetical protein
MSSQNNLPIGTQRVANYRDVAWLPAGAPFPPRRHEIVAPELGGTWLAAIERAEKERARAQALEKELAGVRAELQRAREEVAALQARAEHAEIKAGIRPSPGGFARIRRDAAGYHYCPHCSAPFRNWAPFIDHMRQRHHDPKLAEILQDRSLVCIVPPAEKSHG